MITDEARAVFEQAIELRDSNPDDKLTNLDVLGLLLVAIDKAGGSYLKQKPKRHGFTFLGRTMIRRVIMRIAL